MAHSLVFVAWALALLASSSLASAAIVEHSFHVQNLTVNRLCRNQVITAVNGSLPGPTLRVHEGDTLVVHVNNNSPYNLTIHWHGIFQFLSGWADGAAYVTQCPIPPGQSYTYRFNITGQEGTLWWHAHIQWLRATVYGALVIRPRSGRSYPFPKPHREIPILLGEWWNANVIDVENEAFATGGAPNISDAYTINGRPGDLYPCSSNDTFRLNVVPGKTYMLRIINAALNNQLFFKIANHNLTVVAVDASYTNPYATDVVLVAPGQTTDVLFTADQTPGRYYMAARAYASLVGVQFDNTTTTGILVYNGTTPTTPGRYHRAARAYASLAGVPFDNTTTTGILVYNGTTPTTPGRYYMSARAYASLAGVPFDNTTTTGILVYNGTTPTTPSPIMPVLPAFNDTPTAHRFNSNLTALLTSPFWMPAPSVIDERMFVTVGLGLSDCDIPGNVTCQGPLGRKFAASMNNASFQFPTTLSMLEAFFRNVSGIYTTDFPDNPPVQFDYTNTTNAFNTALLNTTKSTKAKKVKFNATVEIVLQNTALLGIENHPIHLHGFNFYVLAQGFGNYNAATDSNKFNLVNPQERNTIGVPVGGWAVIRFRANNPGVWLLHCHLELHLPLGLNMAFEVENGPTPSTTLPPPPPDFPKC